MTRLSEVAEYLDAYLRIDEGGDWSGAFNGLQVENGGEVSRIAASVDACEAVIEEAAAQGADLLLVHHGLFWGSMRPVTGRVYRKLSRLVRSGMAVYSAHLPLDRHPEVGNNAVLARLLGIEVSGWWGEYEGTPIGVWGELAVAREELGERIRKALGSTPKLLPGGPPRTARVGILTGSGGSLIGAAKSAGLDTLVTGEGAHHTYFDSEELGVNAFYAGHYLTETVGVKALGQHLSDRFDTPWSFVDHPTGL